ncbi:MAG: DUF5320 domain-containing protein [Bacteroidales bacterium]|nr:DUF5320 domain-containing protein [Bacteroidales bacterium]
MARMDGTGPEGKGPKTGRGVGRCKDNTSETERTKLGIGLGKRHKSGGGPGKGKRLKSGL